MSAQVSYSLGTHSQPMLMQVVPLLCFAKRCAQCGECGILKASCKTYGYEEQRKSCCLRSNIVPKMPPQIIMEEQCRVPVEDWTRHGSSLGRCFCMGSIGMCERNSGIGRGAECGGKRGVWIAEKLAHVLGLRLALRMLIGRQWLTQGNHGDVFLVAPQRRRGTIFLVTVT
jgi:hypothetical protein